VDFAAEVGYPACTTLAGERTGCAEFDLERGALGKTSWLIGRRLSGALDGIFEQIDAGQVPLGGGG
jgi:hypothetical protein